jgi:glucose-6-phosphate isomerase
MEKIRFDFNSMFSSAVGARHGVTPRDMRVSIPATRQAYEHFAGVVKNPRNRIALGIEWTRLAFQDVRTVRKIQALGAAVAARYDAVLFLGIGGSFLGLKAAQDALAMPYHNEFGKRPKIYFEGNNLDPDTLNVLLKKLQPRRTCVVVISKSGETTETKVAFLIVERWLKRGVGPRYGRHIIAITDPKSGSLRQYVRRQHDEDNLSFRSLDLLEGVGGRFSELNMGLLHLAVCGIDIRQVLKGADAMSRQCSRAGVWQNPALLYAVLHHVLQNRKSKPIVIMMPFSETLKSTADWYVQLLAESIGKKYTRKIRRLADGTEIWAPGRSVNVGRTPVSARGTNDLHSLQQNVIEGRNDKTVTFIKVDRFQTDCAIPGTDDMLAGRTITEVMHLALEATEWALVRQKRPNCTITLPEVNPYYWGALLFFFEMATAYEAELLNINAFDQPGVEGYKQYMYYKLGKPGLSPATTSEIKAHPLSKNKKFIL